MDRHDIVLSPDELSDRIASGVMEHVATVVPASPGAVAAVIGANEDDEGEDGRSTWSWVVLPTGDVLLGTFPQGAMYLLAERDMARTSSTPVADALALVDRAQASTAEDGHEHVVNGPPACRRCQLLSASQPWMEETGCHRCPGPPAELTALRELAEVVRRELILRGSLQ